MDVHDLTRSLILKNDAKIVMLVADGLGGLPLQPGGPTELEAAATPNLDRLAQRGVQGLSLPVLPGISPGSGPGHLGLFGYDPMQYVIGRGALEATGIGFELEKGDVAVRCNFCTLDREGRLVDRRAGRIPTSESSALVCQLRDIQIPGIDIFVEPVKEHRFVVVFRGRNLGDNVQDTDPQQLGVLPFDPVATDPDSTKTADVAKSFLGHARQILASEAKANFHTMRGFAAKPDLPTYEEVYGLRAAAIAIYPMYKGLARLVGMSVVGTPNSLEEQIDLLAQHWQEYDFFFVHFKYTDSTGEDGNFDAKVKQIELLDAIVPKMTSLDPEVLVVTGDHSTPSALRSHSWHPVPTLLVSDCCRTDSCKHFGETEAIHGGLGQFEAKYLMTLAMANAGRLNKYGA